MLNFVHTIKFGCLKTVFLSTCHCLLTPETGTWPYEYVDACKCWMGINVTTVKNFLFCVVYIKICSFIYLIYLFNFFCVCVFEEGTVVKGLNSGGSTECGKDTSQ